MKALRNIPEQNLLFFDIETTRAEKTLEESSHLYDAWMYRSRYQNEIGKKTGENASPEELFEQKASLYAPFAQICAVSFGWIAGSEEEGQVIKTLQFASEDEHALLSKVKTLLDKTAAAYPEKMLCGFNSTGFDLPMLMRRFIVQRLEIPEIVDMSLEKPWTQKTVDLGLAWRGNAYALDGLSAVCACLSIPSSKSGGIDGSETSEAFYAGRLQEISDYCTRDTIATIQVFRVMCGRDMLEVSNEK